MLIPCHDGDMGAVPKASNGWACARESVLASGSDVPLQYEDECSTTTIYIGGDGSDINDLPPHPSL